MNNRKAVPASGQHSRVIGIDVGGPAKGFHAVLLENMRILATHRTADPLALARWCEAHHARVVAVDAPCRWRGPTLARAPERELAAAGMACYYAPTEQRAREHPFYRWMLPGADLYAALKPAFPLYMGAPVTGPVSFETFPQAIACALAGQIVSAKDKLAVRRGLLERAGISTSALNSIDELDATLCAWAAVCFVADDYKAYGDAADGFIIVPKKPLATRAETSATTDAFTLRETLFLDLGGEGNQTYGGPH